MWIAVVLVIAVLIVLKLVIFKPKSHLEKAYNSYIQSLESLKKDPSNRELKDETVALGREYITVTLHTPGVRAVSESDLMRDIRDACGKWQ
jgi:hypothetical protein